MDTQFERRDQRRPATARLMGGGRLAISTWAGIGVAALAAGLRVWGADFGLPYLYHPDEPGWVAIIQRMHATGDLNPHFFNYPSFFLYINTLVYTLYDAARGLMGTTPLPAPDALFTFLVMGTGRTVAPAVFWLGRLTTAAFGALTPLVLMAATARLTGRRAAGALAGLLLAVAPLAVMHSRYITPDTFVTFFMVLSLWAAARVYQEGRTQDYALAGVAVGLAVGAKYSGVMVGAVVVAAHLLRTPVRGGRHGRLALTALCVLLTFLLTTPFAVLDASKFYADALFIIQHYLTGQGGPQMAGLGNATAVYARLLWTSEGLLGPLAAAGLLWALRRGQKPMGILASFAVPYALLICAIPVRNDRTLLPLIPFLLVPAAALLVEGYAVVRARAVLPARAAQGVAAVLLIVVVGWPLAATWQDTQRLVTPNSRETARVWANANLPQGARVAIESYTPYIAPDRFEVYGIMRMIDQPLDWFINHQMDYLIFGQGMFRRYFLEPDRYPDEVARYNQLFEHFELLKTFNDNDYEVRIYQARSR